ncbi:MAG: calcium-binding protein, partial [Pseudomonas sp.]
AALSGTGNALANRLTGNAAANTLDGGAGADTLNGGAGNDTYVVDNSGDVVTEAAKAGLDTVQASIRYSLGANLENLVLTGKAALSGTGNALANRLTGNAAANTLDGGAGADTLNGGAGNDVLVGGAGKDLLTGGAGNDRFKFESTADSGITLAARDVISDFVRGSDKLDLAALDANTSKVGDQAFTVFIRPNVAFSKAGQLQLKEGVLYGNTDNDSAAEFSIALTGITTITLADIIL